MEDRHLVTVTLAPVHDDRYNATSTSIEEGYSLNAGNIDSNTRRNCITREVPLTGKVIILVIGYNDVVGSIHVALLPCGKTHEPLEAFGVPHGVTIVAKGLDQVVYLPLVCATVARGEVGHIDSVLDDMWLGGCKQEK